MLTMNTANPLVNNKNKKNVFQLVCRKNSGAGFRNGPRPT